jgi:anti-sigma B factor antagonist
VVGPAQFQIECERLPSNVCRLTPVGDLDLATSPRLEAEIEAAIAAGIEQLVIDLSRLRFIDSTGLRLFLVTQERAGSDGWTLILTRPSEAVRSLLEITGARRTVPIVDDWTPPR